MRLRGIIRHDALVGAAQREVGNDLQTVVAPGAGAGHRYRRDRFLSFLGLTFSLADVFGVISP